MTKEEHAWSAFGIPLAWLAELDNAPANNALADALGDRYLYRHYPVFTHVRDAVVDLGYCFSAEDTPLWRDYQSFAMTTLPRIIAGKIIPYFETGIAFSRLVSARPGARLPPGFIVASIKRNYVFHESTHCLAHAVLGTMGAEVRAVSPNERDRAVLEAILAESFANTVEVLGSVFQHMPVSDRLFYPLNSYYPHDEGKVLPALERAAKAGGPASRFALLFLAHFEANLTGEKPNEQIYDRVGGARCATGDYACVREVTDAAFRLSEAFRESTNPAYFELLGMSREYKALADSAWLRKKDHQCFALELANRLWDATGRP